MSMPVPPVTEKDKNTHPKLWFTGFLVLLMLMPLPFGMARLWASDLFGFLTGLLLCLVCYDLYKGRIVWPAGAPLKRLATSAILFGLVLAWASVQRLGCGFFCHPVWTEAQAVLGTPVLGTLSLAPDQYVESLLRMMAYAGCFLLAFLGGRSPHRAGLILKVLVGAAVVYALYGLLMQSTGNPMIFWYEKWAYRDFVTSTFVNKNSYATYAGLGLLCCLALVWRYVKQRPKVNPTFQSAEMAWIEQIGKRDIYFVLMAFAVLAALLLTASRGGITSTLAGCLAMLLSLAVNRRWHWKIWLGVSVLGLVIMGSFAFFGTDMIAERLDPAQLESDTDVRVRAYGIALEVLAENPWLGFGLGSFDSAFRLYRDASVSVWFEHAHNDYLELAIELGIPATLMLLGAILSLVSCCINGVWNRRRQEIFPALAIGATVTIALHSLVDFSMHIPAVAATYAVILGLGVAQSWSSRSQESRLVSRDL